MGGKAEEEGSGEMGDPCCRWQWRGFALDESVSVPVGCRFGGLLSCRGGREVRIFAQRGTGWMPVATAGQGCGAPSCTGSYELV